MKKILTLCLILFSSINLVQAQAEQAEMLDVVRDTQKWKKTESTMKMVWWIPKEYWAVALKDSPYVTPDAVDEITSMFADYSVFVILQGDIGPFGMNFSSDYETSLTSSNGEVFQPIAKEDISNDLNSMLAAMKPGMAATLGPMGENMQIVIFKCCTSDGKNIANPLKEGNFTISLNDEDFKWRLPLGSLIAKKKCPVDGEALSGAWAYCPIHGNKLSN